MRLLILIFLALVAYSTAQSCGTTPIAPNIYVGTSNAVVGGGTVNAYSWPWNVAICTYDWFGNCNFQFGGSIIGPSWILTSASYLHDSSEKIGDYRVQSGVFDESNKKEGTEQVVQLASIIIHPQYDGSHYDIALIQLASPLRFDQFTQPVCLPSYDYDQIQPGQYAWFTGWGYTKDYQFGSPTKQLQQANLYIDPISVCANTYQDSIWDSQMCVGNPQKTTCNYDLGSPLVQQPRQNGNWYQYGIASYRAKNCDAAAVFTRVSPYCSWISSQTGVNCI